MLENLSQLLYFQFDFVCVFNRVLREHTTAVYIKFHFSILKFVAAIAFSDDSDGKDKDDVMFKITFPVS